MFKTFKDKVMGLYNRVTGSTGNETRIKGQGLIELIKQGLKTQTSARIQTTAWIRFVRDDKEGQERV